MEIKNTTTLAEISEDIVKKHPDFARMTELEKVSLINFAIEELYNRLTKDLPKQLEGLLKERKQ